MSVLTLGNDAPGIVGPMLFRPETAAPLGALADALLNTDEGLTRVEREIIAAYVSRQNGCVFCYESHARIAGELSGEGSAFALKWVESVTDDPDTAAEEGRISNRLLYLLDIAWFVVRNSRIPDSTFANAREAGATDLEIHDTVLIAAAFSMFNRYVEAVGNPPATPEQYAQTARRIAEHGYTR